MSILLTKKWWNTIIILLSFSIRIIAQPTVQWDKTYGGSGFDDLTTASRTLDGGYLLCGFSGSPNGFDVTESSRGGDSDYWIVKTDSLGKKIIDKRYGGSGHDVCQKVIQNDEGFLLIGESDSNKSGDKTEDSKGGNDIWLIQIRPDGTFVWDKTLGGSGEDLPKSAIKTADGGYIIAAQSNSNASGDKSENSRGDYDLWIVKIDKLGNKIWDKTFGGSGKDDYPTALIKLKNGNYLVGCGSSSDVSNEHTAPSRGSRDFWIVEFDGNGNKITDKGFGGNASDDLFGIQQVSDGSIFLAGSSKSEANGDKTTPNYGDSDYWLIKLDKNYKKIWDKTYGGKAQDNLVFIDQNKTGYILIGGNSSSPASGNKTDSVQHGLQDFWLLYLDEEGKQIWDRNYGGASNDVPKDLIPSGDGSYLICGISSSNKSFDKSEDCRGEQDYWITKIRCFFDVTLGNDTLVCSARPVTFDATVNNCKNCLYNWSTGEATPRITVTPAQTQKINITITSSDACIFRKDINLVLIQSPDSAAYIVKPPSCRDDNNAVIALDYAHGGTPPYFLVLNKDTFARQIFIDKLKAGEYTVSLVDKKGCLYNSRVVVPNPPVFNVFITPSFDLPFGDSFRLQASASNVLARYFWSDKTIHTLDTILKPFDSQTYSFTGVDTLGCARTISTQVVVRRDNLYFPPTVFSPNGDLINDIYKIYGGSTVVSIDNFMIFNRWGEFMYQSPRIFPSDIREGWDGRFNNKDAPTGDYMFTAQVTYIDGRIERMKGDFVLLR